LLPLFWMLPLTSGCHTLSKMLISGFLLDPYAAPSFK
jgi:hypothetical protein